MDHLHNGDDITEGTRTYIMPAIKQSDSNNIWNIGSKLSSYFYKSDTD